MQSCPLLAKKCTNILCFCWYWTARYDSRIWFQETLLQWPPCIPKLLYVCSQFTFCTLWPFDLKVKYIQIRTWPQFTASLTQQNGCKGKVQLAKMWPRGWSFRSEGIRIFLLKMNNSLTDTLNTSLVFRPEMVTSNSYWLNGLIGFLGLFLSLLTVFVIVFALHSWVKSNNFKSGSVTVKTWLEKAIPEEWKACLRNQKVPTGFQNLNSLELEILSTGQAAWWRT